MSDKNVIQLTGPNGKPVWISINAIVRISNDDSGTGAVIEMGQNWTQSVQETVDTVMNKMRSS